MGMSCHWLGSVFFYQSVGMMVSYEVHCFLSVDTIRFDIYVLLLTLCVWSGKRPLADVWALDTAAKPYEWRKLEPEGDGPPPCMYVLLQGCCIELTHLYDYCGFEKCL
jgi:hypothetical protein